MKKYSGFELYESMEKVPFLDETVSVRKSKSYDLIKECIGYLTGRGAESVIVPWLSHKGLNVEIFGYTVCTKTEYSKLSKSVKNNEISGDPLPGTAYTPSMLEKKLCQLKKGLVTS